MSLLTDEELWVAMGYDHGPPPQHLLDARAIEAAVIKKLSDQEPVAWRFSRGTITKLDSWPHGGNWQPLYLHPKPQSKWQPIETAPYGNILVFIPDEKHGEIYTAKWNKNVKVVGGAFSFDRKPATHWQPLPQPPEAK